MQDAYLLKGRLTGRKPVGTRPTRQPGNPWRGRNGAEWVVGACFKEVLRKGSLFKPRVSEEEGGEEMK